MTTKLAFNQIDGLAINVKDFGVTGSGDESAGMAAALAAGDVIDLQGLSISTGALSKTTDALKIFSSKPGAKLTFNGAANTENFILITTSTAAAEVVFMDFELDCQTNAAKGLHVTNSTTGKRYFSRNVKVSNCTQTASTGLAAGHYIYGGFTDVIFENPEADTINSTGGSLVSSGIRTGQNGTAVSANITVVNPIMTSVTPGDDGDGLALLQSFPYTINGYYKVIGGHFKNCHKRAIKTQCFKTLVHEPYIERTEVHVTSAGNIDIDIQYGNGEIYNPTFDYDDDTKYPDGGIISLNGPRGETSDNTGNSTHLIGGVCNIGSIVTAPDYLFNTSTYDANDKINRPMVSGFTFNGEVDHIWQIRPLASATFNDDIVFSPIIKDSIFETVNTSVFELDRSGTGYAFVSNAELINNTIESGAVDKDVLITTNIGITYGTVAFNTNIKDSVTTYSGSFAVDTGSTLSKNYTLSDNSSAEITIMYSTGAGVTYHLARKSTLTLGNGAAEDQESNIQNITGLGGTLSITSTWGGSTWDVQIDKSAGSGAVAGNLDIIIDCPQGLTEV